MFWIIRPTWMDNNSRRPELRAPMVCRKTDGRETTLPIRRLGGTKTSWGPVRRSCFLSLAGADSSRTKFLVRNYYIEVTTGNAMIKQLPRRDIHIGIGRDTITMLSDRRQI